MASDIEVWRKLDGKPLPVALQRLVDEVKVGATSNPSAYNRIHNRHNR